MPSRKRGSSTSRGYGTDHRRRRAAAVASAIGSPCGACGEVMLRGQELDFDHETPLAVDPASRATRVVHASCNRSAGGRLGSERAKYAPTRTVQ